MFGIYYLSFEWLFSILFFTFAMLVIFVSFVIYQFKNNNLKQTLSNLFSKIYMLIQQKLFKKTTFSKDETAQLIEN